MSWKSVEMQVALPRTMDASKQQDQIFKQNQHFQEALAQSQVIQENQKRKKVQEFEEVYLQKEDQKESLHEEKANKKKQTNDNLLQSIKHPYLGNHFDSRS
jgi:hypothetical protein